jgi:hypothetical protein
MSGENVDPRQHGASEYDQEAALLITSLRGAPIDVPGNIDWPRLRDLAVENGVLAIVHESLSEMRADLPGFFASAAGECRRSAEEFAAILEELLHSFAERAIDVLPLKGPALAAVLYGDATSRSYNDLDLLVRPGDYRRAEALLLDLGFVGQETDDYHRRFVRDGIPVELHLEVASPRYFRFDSDGIWRRSRIEHFRGKATHAMCADDLVLYLCLHGLKHGFSRLIWILDAARALRAPGLIHDELVRGARREGLEPWLLIGCEVVRAMLPGQVPEALDAVIAEEPETARRARQVAASLFTEGLEVVNDHRIRSFYLQTERSARWRWRCRMGFLVPTIEDYRWAEHHGINRRLMHVLRPFRLLKKHGPGPTWRATFPRV